MSAATIDAGREMDVRIARGVMGLLVCDQPHDSDIHCSHYGEQSHYSFDGYDGGGNELPRFSTDIAAAWQVVERLVAGGARVSVMNRAAGPWGCCIIQRIGMPQEWTNFQYGATPAEAICRAALAATEAQ